jgi:hypothetical protein
MLQDMGMVWLIRLIRDRSKSLILHYKDQSGTEGGKYSKA